ncbi:HD family phosphohydrolase [Paenibacillus apiarius]|uniref:HDIG domain-containing protein n=1 Tax=Paenibacillus apiarius TaxID=46240 RepID=A0ABT4DL60_9BACL|nr:HDIG domain-containing metalloprotein [Paenibacillus apiarius]MCY9513538.1 HDIG domain-containing protein [Paenibacillus apiarius]MCY9518089.1 HDIG domain-containing protein [Paenibacillus apiarius]MCY9551510.1 HDIG domain-containing protein [Paenibacillus apiarius]MCY9558664.1 HDIG domain-containing protein [Paenibacillus apiarius]MCY9684022.1 HDIG domain-containing protein [Paenibacillus apiarius]
MLKTIRSGNGSNSRQVNMAGWKYSVGVRFLLFLFLTLLFYFSLAPSILPEKFDIEVNVKSEKDIVAPIQIPDKKATLKAQEQAAERVQPIYQIISLKNERLVDKIFDRIEQLNSDDLISYSQKVELYRSVVPEMVNEHIRQFITMSRNASTYTNVMLDEMSKRIEEQKYPIPEETFIKMARLSKEDITEMKPVARELVSKLMIDPVPEAAIGRAKVPEYVNASSLNKRSAREVVQELVRLSLTPNKFYDDDATKEAKVQARENTPPVFIKQGDIFVKKGEVITQEMYELLKENDLLKSEVNYWPQFGLLLLSALFSLVLFMFMRQGSHTHFKFNNVQLLMLVLIFAISIIAILIIGYAQTEDAAYIGFVAPVAMGVILITLLIDLPLAYMCAVVLSILTSIILNTQQGTVFDFHFGFFALVTSYAAIFATHRASQRSTILKAGIMVCIFGSLTVLVLGMLGGDPFNNRDLMLAVAFAFASGLLTAVLVLGLMPFFEVTFGILSALKLVELSNPNHPLLRKLLTETPGTYHHSVMVGNLAEQAAEAIGANGLLCRVGAFYHDIGKTKRPSYFIENQTNMDNPHDFIDPKLSTSIIVAHARDGAEMLKDYKLPKPIRDIAEQHHGTTFLKFFYYKALKLAEEQGIEPDFTEDDFRYPGPKAQSKEAAVVGIADCVEAAVRSLRHPTVEQIESMIQKIIKDRLDDNQFNECDLTLRELDIVGQSLKETVMGIFHSRIEYPDDAKLKQKEEQAAEDKKQVAEAGYNDSGATSSAADSKSKSES